MAISVSFVSERLSLHIHKGRLSSAAGAVRAAKLGWISVCMGGLPMGGPGDLFFFPQLKNSDCTEFTHCKSC